MTPTIAVLLFPGTNCELEALRACKRSHMKAELVRWNDPDKKKLKKYDGYILPGGFSYEDRGRSGVIAAKEEIMETVRAEAEKGKPVLGICNGAQILVESGMIPGLSPSELEMALAWNERIQKGKMLGVGFYNSWIHMRSDSPKNRTVFNRFSQNVIMHVPVAHGEGRFTTKDPKVLKQLIQNHQTLFRYCTPEGKIINEFPVNPNGAMYNLAGVCNPQGNVLALMPHPERTENGQPIFDSMAQWFSSGKKLVTASKKSQNLLAKNRPQNLPKIKPAPHILITIKPIITDNAERTIENTCKKMGLKNIRLTRKTCYGFDVADSEKLTITKLKSMAQSVLESGEIINFNKEVPTVTIQGQAYRYDKKEGLSPKETVPSVAGTASASGSKEIQTLLITDLDNYAGQSVAKKLAPYFKKSPFKKVEKGVWWEIKNVKSGEQMEKLLGSHILQNPHSMEMSTLSTSPSKIS